MNEKNTINNGCSGSPAEWSVESLRKVWDNHLETMAVDGKMSLPLKRIKYQAEHTPVFQDVFSRWSRMDGQERSKAFDELVECAKQSTRYIDPVCVCCGTCCRSTSPTLMPDDAGLVRDDLIPRQHLVTLKEGELVRSPFQSGLFALEKERIKIKEKEGSKTCILFDEESNSCTIYQNKPTQCRAQACWDPEPAEDCERRPHLSRRELFGEIESLTILFDEHDRRCSFALLQAAFKKLSDTKGSNVNEVIDLLAFDEHLRDFTADRFEALSCDMELLFGRSLSQLVRLFGFRVDQNEDGMRTLLPDKYDQA